MPRGENLLDFSSGIRLTGLAAFELHTFLGQLDLFRCQIERFRNLWYIRANKETGEGNREGNSAVDNKQPSKASA